MLELPLSDFRKMAVEEFDSGKLLAHASKQSAERGYDQFPIIDIDSHHYELESFNEILEYMPDPVMKQLAKMANSGNSKGVGVMPGGGMTIRLPQLVGLDRARRMSLTGDYIDAETARDWGLVVEVVPHESLLERARQVAATIASIPSEYLTELRRGYDEIGALSGQEAFRAEAKWSRAWMADHFDQSRLTTEREKIVARGRAQTTELGGASE